MPAQNVLQGLHTIIADDHHGNTASTTVTFLPMIVLNVPGGTTKGGPGTPVQITGAAFTANEQVKICWGNVNSTPLATGTTDGSGNLLQVKITVPLGTTPGRYKVYAVRSHQTPPGVYAWFHVMTPDIDANPPGIRAGQSINLWGSGFAADEKVVVSWNANGGQQLKSFITDDLGEGGVWYKPPSAPHGTYTLTAIGQTSHIQATGHIAIGPGIAIKPYGQQVPGTTVTVIGGGFAAGEQVRIHVQGSPQEGVTVTTDVAGAFQVPLKLPTSYKQPDNALYAYADSISGSERAKTLIAFVPTWAALPLGSTYGQPVTVYGEGYAANEPVNIYWDYQQPQQSIIGAAKAKSDGTFSITVTTPSAPYQGRVPVAAVGAVSNLVYQDTSWIYPGMVLSPPSGRGGTTLQINGGGYAANESVTVSFGSTTVGTVTTDSLGGFTTSYVVPPVNGPGDVVVKAVGNTSGVSTQAIFAYPHIFKIAPSSGPSGTIITVSGQNFAADFGTGIYWYDPSTGSQTSLGVFMDDSNGTFSGQVTAPSNLTPGQTYDVQAWDRYANLTVQQPFVAQPPCVQCLQLTPNNAIPGATISVQGSGFTPDETVNVYFQQPGNGIVSTTVSSSGTFTVPLTVPVAYQSKVLYYVYAVNTSGSEKASAQFFYTTPALWLNDPYQNYNFGDSAEFDGSGFAAGEQVNFYWSYGPPVGKILAGSTTAASDGSINATLTYPSIPFNTQINLEAIGASSSAKATLAVNEEAAIYANPDAGYAGTQVQVQGGGFAKAENVTVSFDGTVVDSVTTDNMGGFVVNFIVPSSDQMGYDNIEATGNSSGVSANTDFNSMPAFSISPTSGKSGTIITLKGSHFTPSETFSIWWYDPSTNVGDELGFVTADGSGSFTTTITAPSGLSSGTAYYVQILDAEETVWASAPFTAQ